MKDNWEIISRGLVIATIGGVFIFANILFSIFF